TVGAVVTARDALGWIEPTFDQGQWLVKSVFWLLAAKILQDKKVPGFIQLDLDDLDTVFGRLARHYHSTQPSPVTARDDKRRAALLEAVAGIKRFAHLGLLSTEALAYLYESALIDKETRQALGTHSTPSWMVDYVVGTLRPWIDEMPVADRRVFEPACGHGGFLISGLRLLSEMRPKGYGEDRRSYLRKRLRGIEFDPFAVEIARLSLTLTDVPNPNGWALSTGDMFAGDVLAKEAAAATIVLCNPPFERFAASDRKPGWQLNKASETLRRILANLPEGGVFGVVLPPGFLKSKQDAALRKSLLSGCEVKEITLFADKVFRRGAPEPVVLLGRKSKVSATATVVYQRVREGQIQQFKTSYAPSSHELVVQSSFRLKNKGSLFFAELSALWEGLAHLPRLGDMAEIGQGLSHRGADDETVPRNAIRESAERANGLTSGFGGWTETQMTHELPTERWLNLDEKMISRRRSGTKRGEGQLLLNYPRVSREGWCLKALIDREGHPVTSDFSVVRPRRASLLVFWAFLNSPLANAFAHTHSDKWHVLVGTLRKMPVPDASSQDLTTLERAVSTYLEAAELFSKAPKQASPSAQGDLFERPVAKAAPGARPPTAEEVRILHWRVDAEVLRLYELPAELERNLLVFFAGVARRG
ncbi:MAG: class I SAM-dependent DNA methyltransferase, partial [Byssovorax sp.]